MAGSSSESNGASPDDRQHRSLRDLLQTLHDSPREDCDERLAPPVDRERLRALARCELDQQAARELLALVRSFRGWADAYTAVLVEEFSAADEEAPGDDR